MENVSIVNKKGFLISPLEIVENGVLKTYKLKENEIIAPKITNFSYIKPRWDGVKWVEGATKEEIKEYKEKNKTEENAQVTEEQQLLSSVLLENAEIKEQLKEQQELSATLVLQIAQLKGENTDV